ncbi:helix-turn-helix domain-containing protein [Streptomyces sp. NEAU-W12]|uniref:helix-turn-helix domain-containing protein n=1 Tax=Streptomyces sp. NEAU-W12 TaxID=2994668 RepID=UPI00224AB8BE|nr:helix-turn-helix domain-containing protein [Streptomyces sp. NEAU-W12]MCX2927333.1 peptidoglycan-binding protein [Streptomyces sp. NEAU-W12]
MARWRPLPEGLGPYARRLVTGLRELKDRTGLSLSALERRTAYSRSSWERYLNGKNLPPPEAIVDLARLAGEDAGQWVALRELAGDDWNGAARPVAEQPDVSGPDTEGAGAPGGGTYRSGGAAAARASWVRRRAPYLVSLLILAGTAVTIAATSQKAGGASGQGADGFEFRPGTTYDCPVEREGASLTAGHSDTRRAYLHQLVISWDVVEAQCLLEYHGYPVAVVDGAYDMMTERAVKRFQEDRDHLVVDGVIGEHTWEALRR